MEHRIRNEKHTDAGERTSSAALASLRRRSRLLLSSGSEVSAFSRSRSEMRPRSDSSNATLELFLWLRFLADTALTSLLSTGVIGVRPLLESPVELAGLFPRTPRPYPVPANGLVGGVANDVENREDVRDLPLAGFSVTGEVCGEDFIADFGANVLRDVDAGELPGLRLVSGLLECVTKRGGRRS